MNLSLEDYYNEAPYLTLKTTEKLLHYPFYMAPKGQEYHWTVDPPSQYSRPRDWWKTVVLENGGKGGHNI